MFLRLKLRLTTFKQTKMYVCLYVCNSLPRCRLAWTAAFIPQAHDKTYTNLENSTEALSAVVGQAGRGPVHSFIQSPDIFSSSRDHSNNSQTRVHTNRWVNMQRRAPRQQM